MKAASTVSDAGAGVAAALAGVGLGLDLAAGDLVAVAVDGFGVAALRGRAFVVLDEFEFWAKTIVVNANRSAKLKENRFMICSS